MFCPFRKKVIETEEIFLPCYEKECMAYMEYMKYDKNLVKYQTFEGDVHEDRLGDPDIVKLCKLIEYRKNIISGGFCV